MIQIDTVEATTEVVEIETGTMTITETVDREDQIGMIQDKETIIVAIPMVTIGHVMSNVKRKNHRKKTSR
jgi:hypothetical protein